MIIGCGVDIEYVRRFKNKGNNKQFLEWIFTLKEIEYCNKKPSPHISFAGKFCAKEAVLKALNKKFDIKDIEIINQKDGSINIYIRGKILKWAHCSISHTDEYAVAFVVIENGAI